MSSKTTITVVPVDEPSTAQTHAGPPVLTPAQAGPPAQAGTPVQATTPQPATGDEFPFESPEFGVGGFFPHLDAPTDG